MSGKFSCALAAALAGVLCVVCAPVCGTDLSTVRGVVHDPSHRPIGGAQVSLAEQGSRQVLRLDTTSDGQFVFNAVPAGVYTATATATGFASVTEELRLTSGQAPALHFQLQLASRNESVTVSESAGNTPSESVTPSVLITRRQIDETPGGGLTNSLSIIADNVPGAYVTHDQLHLRGGHQVTWAIDGVPVPSTNIASNVGPQIDPKDIDTLEVQRGGYSSQYGDRTYGVLDVVPRTGFESNRQLEVNTTYGAFQQTNDQVNLGDHTEKFAYFASLNGNFSQYGLESPGPQIQHDTVWGMGGFGSLLYNPGPSDQLRLVGTARGDDYEIPSSLDTERERDEITTFTWVHSFAPGVMLTTSPFFHFNRANYDGDPNASPVSTVQHVDSSYAGAQIALNAVTSRHDASAGVFAFGQREREYIDVNGPDGSGVQSSKTTTGQLEAVFLEDQYKLTPLITLTAGLRVTHFAGGISENAADPRVGLGVRIPHLNWVLHGFYGRYYQAPPLSTVTGPVLEFAVSQGLGIIPLHGERDQENQAGITVPLRDWTFDFNSFRLRAKNYFDHNAVGDSNVFLPLTIAGARISGQELTVRSPKLFKRVEATLAYSYQKAEAEGAITGGLTDLSPPGNGYFLLDHDQRNTLHTNVMSDLPGRSWVSAAMYYGSGFTDGSADVPAHLEPHTTFDIAIGKSFGENLSLSVNALNVTNRRFLLDNSLTFGGRHYADPRQIWVQMRYRFRY